jgi:hypothetical protein
MNQDTRRVILFGESLIFEGVRASLKNIPALEIIVLDKSMRTPAEAIREFRPAVFIFDVGEVHPDLPLEILQEPALLLVGIDQVDRKALVWSARQASAIAAADLLNIICPGFESSEFVKPQNAEAGRQSQ